MGRDTISKLQPNISAYASLTFVDLERVDVLEYSRQFARLESLKANWRPPAVQYQSDDLPIGDILSLPGGPVFSKRACDTLQELLTENGELLPLYCGETVYYAFNVLTAIEAVNLERSNVEWVWALGSEGPRKKIGRVLAYEFIPETVAGCVIFRVPSLYYEEVFVTSTFEQSVQAGGLEGFSFDLLWPQDAVRAAERERAARHPSRKRRRA